MKKLTKKVKVKIQKYIGNNQPKLDWNRSDFDKNTVEEILTKEMDEYIDSLYEMNLEYVSELEHYFINEIVEMWDEYDEDELREFVWDHVCVDMNVKNLVSNLPDVTLLAYVYSNYDCCNSFDEFEPEGYLYDVFQRVKDGVKQDDYLWEFQNGAYGGSLFCFAIKTDVPDALELMEKIKTGKMIKIYKGTQFGFFSSFQGAGSMFEKTTFQDMRIPIKAEGEYDGEYDFVGITADILQSYNMADVYGSSSFIDDGSFDIIGKRE